MKVVLIDDHEIFRLGLRALLEAEPGIEVIGEAGSGEQGLDVVATTAPDIVVLDYSMPGLSGLEILARLRRQHPALGIIFLTASRSEAVLSEALQAGAQGIILKQDAGSQLVQAILSVARGEQLISSSSEPLVGRHDALADLTKRERQVLRLIANGYRNREISEALSISLKTVDTHRTNLMRKLNLHNLVDLVDFANQIGLVDSSI